MRNGNHLNGIDPSKTWVKLNVGGKQYLTTKTTLSKYPNSFLARLIADDSDLSTDIDEFGAFMIDRDPNYFDPILNFLRHGKIIMDKNMDPHGVLEESEFYNLPELTKLIHLKILEKSGGSSFHSETNLDHIYRVIHCREHELTPTISGLSDGWKFKQLINVGSAYAGDGKDEYLCIVYRECNNAPKDY